jgi:hypothetical protein
MIGPWLGLLLALAGEGRLGGHVYDQAGTPIRDVKVTASAAGRSYLTHTNQEGSFAFGAVLPGTYVIEVSAPKLRTIRQTGVRVSALQPAEVDLIMEVDGPVEEYRDVGCRGLWISSTRARIDPVEEWVGPLPAWPTGRLVIHEEGQPDLLLRVSDQRLEGRVRGVEVSVVVRARELTGYLAGEPVSIRLRGDRATGYIGGHDVAFWLYGTPGGHLLRGDGVGHTIRFEQSQGGLSWLPACERPLARLPRQTLPESVYEGVCASGRRMRLILPDELDRMAPLPRLILLSSLLTGREEPNAVARLFPPKVGR